jgi:hypothetical protein
MRLLAALCIGVLASTAPIPAQQQSTPQPSTKTDGALAPVVSDVFAAQVLLDRAGFSSGEIDGDMGANVKRALMAFQQVQGLPPSGELDPPTWQKLRETSGNVSPLTSYTVTDADIAGPFTPTIPDDMMVQAKLKALDYRDPVEAIAERFHLAPALLRTLNRGVPLDKAGSQLMVANVTPFDWAQMMRDEKARKAAETAARGTSGRGPTPQPARGDRSAAAAPVNPNVVVYVTKSTSALTVEENGRVIFHAPVTSGSTHDPLPIGQWKVTTIQRNPVFHYNPDLFWDARP